jgi:hypothetical protein
VTSAEDDSQNKFLGGIIMITFFSNHADTSFIQEHTGEEVTHIKHPYIEPEWSTVDIIKNCTQEIKQAVEATTLIINGDYTIVSLIVLERFKKGKKTGFMCMKKLNEPTAEKDSDGNIIHRNVLKPIGIRWI